AGSAISKSACSEMIIALLPPSSRILLPSRDATAAATALPIRVDPVADTSAIRRSLASRSPRSLPPCTRQETPSGMLFRDSTSAMSAWQATAVIGVFSDGFHTHTLPHTQAMAAFQLHTATGKLKAEI